MLLLPQIIRDWAPVLDSAAGLAIVGITFKGLKSIIEMRKDVANLMTNHLPHIYDEIAALRTDFTNSLIEGKQRGQN